MSASAQATSIHAGALVCDRFGAMVFGPPGAGKSTLVTSLIRSAQTAGYFAALVADDRVILRVHHGRAVARCPASIAGCIEVRGYGIDRCAYVPAARIHLAIVLVPGADIARLPEPSGRSYDVGGIILPAVRAADAFSGERIAWAALGHCIRYGTFFPADP